LGKDRGLFVRHIGGLPGSSAQAIEVTDATSSSDELESWAGDRIISLGDYHDDLPEGLLSLEEQEEVDEVENNGRRMYSFAEVAYDSTRRRYHRVREAQDGLTWVLRNLSTG
jgi:hypothetical protein